MPDMEKVIEGLRDIDMFIAGRLGHEKAKNFLRTIDETIALLKEQQQQIWEFQDQVEYLTDKLKEQEEQKWKWLQTIADTQLAISPTGYEREDELAKRGWEWNGLQMAWEIIAGEERSEHPRLVRCKDCFWNSGTEEKPYCQHHDTPRNPNWFCASGEKQIT